MTDLPSPELLSGSATEALPSASTSSTMSNRRRPVSGSPAHLHFASDVFSSSADVPTPPSSARRSEGRRTPVRQASAVVQPPEQVRRSSMRVISADPLIPSHPFTERRASVATSATYNTAPSSATARRTSFAKKGKHVRPEDADLWEFGESNGVTAGNSGSVSSRKGQPDAPTIEEEEFQQRLARIDLDRVMQALQASPPRPDYIPPPLSSRNTAATLHGRRNSYGMSTHVNTPPRQGRDEPVRPKPPSPDPLRETQKEKRGLRDLFAGRGKGKEKLSPAEEEERLRKEEAQQAERIRHIHSTLTQSTLSRAQSAMHQFDVRYSLLSSTDAYQLPGKPPPNFLSVVKWKKSKRDVGKQKRRSEQAAASRAALLLNRTSPLSRVDSADSSGRPVATLDYSNTSSPAAPSSRRPSFALPPSTGDVSTAASTFSEGVSAWAEQLITSKHRRKRSIITGVNASSSSMRDSTGSGGKVWDWDFTARDVLEYISTHGEVEPYVPPPHLDEVIPAPSTDRHSLDLSKILESPARMSQRSAVSAPSERQKSAPPSVMSLVSITSDDTGDPQYASVKRPLVNVNAVPSTTGNRRLTSLDEHESPPEDAPVQRQLRRPHPPSAPESPVAKPRHTRSHSYAKPGSLSQAIGSLLTLSGSAMGSSEALPAGGRQGLAGKRWPGVRGGGPGHSDAASPEGSASEHPLSGVNSDDNSGLDALKIQMARRAKRNRLGDDDAVAQGMDSSRSSIAGRRHRSKLPSISFTRRGSSVVEAEEEDQMLSAEDTTPGPRPPKPLLFIVPDLPWAEKKELEIAEEEDDAVDSEAEEAEYEKKSRVLSTMRTQIARMDNILANGRIRQLAQELLDMRDQTFDIDGGEHIVLPPLSNAVRGILPRPRMPVPRKTVGPLSVGEDESAEGWVQRGALARHQPARSASMPMPKGSENIKRDLHKMASRSRALSDPTEDAGETDLFPHIDRALEGLEEQWKDVDNRVVLLLSQQKSAFDHHEEIQHKIENVQTVFFQEARMMDRLDDRIHQLKTRNLGNSMLFTFLAGLAEVLLFTVWLLAKIIQIIIFKIPKLGYHFLIRSVTLFWWLIRWVLFLDYLWPSYS